MALEEKIIEWGAGARDWQRMILRRVADGNPLTDAEYDRLADDLVAGKPVKKVDFGVAHLPQAEPGGPQVQLVSVNETRHVNAISSDAPLTFGGSGLTVVYGHNGSGKSGYARVLKRIARARHQEQRPVLSDVFRDTSAAKPEAELEVSVDGTVESVLWPTDERPELRRMLFYDDDCGKEYIDTESDFPYRPSALLVMEGLIHACGELQRRIQAKLTANAEDEKEVPKPDAVTKDTETGKYLTNLSGGSSPKQLDELIQRSSPKRIEELTKLEAQLRSADTTRERARLVRDAEKLDSLAEHLVQLEGSLGPSAIDTLTQQRDRLTALQHAADELAKKFEAEPVSGVGSQLWKELWESARTFSEKDAYPDEGFPKTDARCVLCQQELKAKAADRLTRFEEFVTDDTQTKLATARTTWGQAQSKLRRLAYMPASVESSIKDLSGEHEALTKEAESILKGLEDTRTATLKAIDGPRAFTKHTLEVEACAEKLRLSATAARESAEKLKDPDGVEEELARTVLERAELELLGSVKKQKADILHEIGRRKVRESLRQVENEVGTGAISRKVTQFSEEHITVVVRDGFTRQTQDLGLRRVTMERTRTVKGAAKHQPALVGARQRAELPEVFSEGEKTALGLAAYFTEAELDESKSALILDDPVSSLDHVRREMVADRLAEFAVDRQVVVFTHDQSLVTDLKLAARGRSVNVTERSVCKTRGDEKPGQCQDVLPWQIRDSRQRIGDLRTDLARIEREYSGWDDATYEKEVSTWAGGLSETWESIFSQELVGRILAEGGQEVHTKMVKILARFSERDDNEFQASYSKVSRWAKRHHKSGKVNYVAPTVEQLRKELDLVDEWFKRVKKYQN